MEGKDKDIPFLKSLLAVLPELVPFSKQAKRTKKLLQEMNHPSFFTNEKKQVERMEHLLESGRYDEALRQLTMDTDVDNPIQYFNRIRCNEQKILLEGNQNSPQVELPSFISKDRLESVQIAANQNHKCQWTGFNEKFDALECANEKFCHPWKECKNVCNQVEAVTSNFCIYHEKYCVDKGKRHKDEMILITVPNMFGLCSECHILQEGNPPAKIRRHPGVRRKFCLKEKKILQPKSMSVECMDKGALLQEYNPMEVLEKAEGRKDTQLGMSRIIAARNIGQNLRMSLVRKKKVRQDDLHHLQSMSAVWIQSLFRYYKLRQRMKYVQSREIIIGNSGEQGEMKEARENLEPRSQEPSRAAEVLYNSDGIRDECQTILCLPCNYISQKIVSRKGSDRLACHQSTKCEASACQVCNESKRQRPSGRKKIRTIPYHNYKLTDDTIALDKLFLERDFFELGSLRRSVFLEVLRELWQKTGQSLLPDEILATTNAFEREGHIDYVKYARFAKHQKFQPCSLHSRIVCPECIHRSRCYSSNNCIKYQEDPEMKAFCVCGKYRSRHDPLPLMGEQDIRKRGFRMFSKKDLKRTFYRQAKPDTGSEIKFNSLKEESISRSRSCNWVSHDKNRQNVRAVHSLPSPDIQMSMNEDNQIDSATCEESKETTETTNESRRCSKEYVKTEANAIIFSSKRLSVMLNNCVEYRNASSRKKITTPCPLCELGFFDTNLLQNHLMRRHTLSDIEYALSCNRALQCGDHDGRTYRQIRVDWVGRYIIVPPLPPPVPLNICYHHVPPHPKCNLCLKTANSSPLFPPIRFYKKSFVECRTNVIHMQGVGEEWGDKFADDETRCFHFDVEDDELAVVYKEEDEREEKVGKLVSLCEDARNNFFVGVQRYLSTVPHPVDVTVDLQSNEWIIESTIKFVDMTKIVGRRRIVHCPVEGFEVIEKEIINQASGALEANLGFCRYSVTNNALVPL